MPSSRRRSARASWGPAARTSRRSCPGRVPGRHAELCGHRVRPERAHRERVLALGRRDIPADVTSLPTGAGSEGGALPQQVVVLRNDAGAPGYVGAAPPPGHGEHRYYVVVHAVDVPSLGLPDGATPAYLGFNLSMHTLARATLVGRFGQ